MTTSKPTINRGRISRPTRRAGYSASIGINLVMIWIVTNIVDWDILPFLTEDFEQLVPIAVFSLVVGIVLYVAYLLYDPPWFRILGDAINSAFAFVVILRTFQVFPFEFESEFWTGATRVVLILVGIATAIATLVNIGKLVSGRVGEEDLVNRRA